MSYSRLQSSAPDYLFISLLIILIVFGLVMLASASSELAKIKFGDSYYYLNHQLLFGLGPGLIGFFIGLFWYYGRWEKLALPMLLVSLVFMILVFTPAGFNVKGGNRWINIGFLTFQPSEILKLTFFIYLAAWISKSRIRSKSFIQGFLPFLFLVSSVMILILFQRSTTIAILILSAAIITYFAAGARFRFLILGVLMAALSLSVIIYITPYRFQRILTFLNPEADRLGASYQINQALIAIGSGGLTGVGFGQSTTKLNYLPEPIGDSIFAVIAEELGFLGALILIILFFLLIWRGFWLAKRAPDNFGCFLVTGFTTLIGLQAFVNMAAISGFIPLTGVPLPFISYGGTALATFCTMSGIIVNVSRYRK